MTSFEECVVLNRDSFYRRALYLTQGNRDDAEDIVQQAIVRAYTHYDQFRREAEFKSWFWQVLQNIYLDYLRQKRRHSRVVSLDSPEWVIECPDMARDLEQETVDAAFVADIVRCMRERSELASLLV